MKCPNCNFEESKVIDSRTIKDGVSIRRRRECLDCRYRFTTYEYILSTPIIIIKKNGDREDYERQKLQDSFHKACNKRPVSEDEINDSIERIEEKINNLSNVEIQSSEVGELVMDELKNIDTVSFIRFASVYRDFKEVKDFQAQIDDLQNE
ncbi:MAG: transcriptional repressor NrdR [Candidatus Marinimicrobia bacterium]|nr:transcriptional repressor NrdR [Candidatus Neomarinimicrobiota bacterium]MBL7022638.1 transcriptional repressor NrdR [Candidatus Neomarinimicrobiota bacterium]